MKKVKIIITVFLVIIILGVAGNYYYSYLQQRPGGVKEKYVKRLGKFSPPSEMHTYERVLSRSELDNYIIQNIPEHQKKIIAFEWWQQFDSPSEIDTAIEVINAGLTTGERAKWTEGLTETAYAAKYGLISPDELYYIGLRQQSSDEERRLKEIRERNRYLLEECLDQTYYEYINNWDRECEGLGMEKDCGLPSWLAERVDKSYKEARDECFRIYPQD